MKHNVLLIILALALTACKSPNNENKEADSSESNTTSTTTKALEVVSELAFRPGNVAVNSEGRVFSTVHPLGNHGVNVHLIEVVDPGNFKPYPNKAIQSERGYPTDATIDAPLGVKIDKHDVLWVIDMGMNRGKTRLWAFDTTTNEEVFRFDFPEDIAPKGSFVQDLAVDEKYGYVYLADIADPGIIILNLETKTLRRFADTTVESEDIDMVIDEQVIHFGGEPSRVAVNPITLSHDRETLYYGAMNGTKWYSVPTTLFRENASDTVISQAISVNNPKPISDGVATDSDDNHYFTNVQDYGLDVYKDGKLQPIIRDKAIDWPDNVALYNGYIYIAVNQLHKSPPFTGDDEQGTPPYYIYKLKL